MAKFYVESGSNLQEVVVADNLIEALLKALRRVSDRNELQLADVVIVNERGFVWQREGHELHGDEIVIPTRLLLGEPAEDIQN
ncbi:hypothetical protein [Lignipirellula cremea]|uniref:Uncharacterized protein n=1 Tax=Lignipirellula cremea TaxID=2528010 RepID=A0A518E2T8_9BACT|nr:hypothetical protein [Lignipirellula cremea]QDU98408.1 hypothetical protein Pla8534_62760 [Lignipirellula cremea]